MLQLFDETERDEDSSHMANKTDTSFTCYRIFSARIVLHRRGHGPDAPSAPPDPVR